MTREEERIIAAREYNDSITFSSPSNVLHFEAGAKWADEHPNFENVWHDASEGPNIECQVLLINEWLKSLVKTFNNRTDWKIYVKDEKVIMWAYINDLTAGKCPK